MGPTDLQQKGEKFNTWIREEKRVDFLTTSWVPFVCEKAPLADCAENVRLSDAYIRELKGKKTSNFKSIWIDSFDKEIDLKVLKVLTSENITVMLLEDDDLYAEYGKNGSL